MRGTVAGAQRPLTLEPKSKRSFSQRSRDEVLERRASRRRRRRSAPARPPGTAAAAARRRPGCRGGSRPWRRRASSPIRRRVRKVDDMPCAVLVEELDEVEVRADADDQRRALLVGQEHARRPGSCRRRGATTWSRPEVLEAARGRARGRRGRRGRSARRRSAAPRRWPSPCRPATTSGRSPASRIASAPPSTPTRTGRTSCDVGAQRAQVLLVGGAADDDQDVAVAKARARRREVDLAGEELALLADPEHRVLRERLDRLVHALAAAPPAAPRARRPRAPRPRRAASPSRRTSPPSRTIASPSRSSSKSGAAGASTSRTPARARTSGPAFGIAPGRGAGDVDDGPDAARDQVLGRDPVEVARGR